MAPSEDLDVMYCEGWDPAARAIVGVLPSAAARERDEAGEQYAVLLGDPGRPYALIEVAWRHRYAGVWFFDDALRRARKRDFRRFTDDRLFLLETVERRYASDGQAEHDPAVWRRTRRYARDGRYRETLEPSGPSGPLSETWDQAPAETLWEPAPRFGAWASLVRADRDRPSSLPSLRHPADPGAAAPAAPAGLPPERRPWSPPRPLAPSNLDALFRAGTRFALPSGGGTLRTVRIDVRDLGRLRMPTGRLLAVDPGIIFHDRGPLEVTVPPGEYPVALAVARWEPPARSGRVAAARLLVRDEPVASWELGLSEGEDAMLLGDGEFYGFGVDAGMACIADGAAAGFLLAVADDDKRYHATYVDADLDGGIEVTDPETGANAFAFTSGWGDGDYPVWVGRTAAGAVACFVADLLVVADAPPLP
jgi:hypothetical protein